MWAEQRHKRSAAGILRPLAPLFESSRHYSLEKSGRDALAGLTGSVLAVPQAMAYALIAGVDPQYGIYAAIIQSVVGALFTSCEHLATGPTNTQSLLIASTVHRLAGGDPQRYLQLVFALAFIKGVIQLALAAVRFGDLVRYVSQSVIAGLSSGAGILIIVGQIPAFLGITVDKDSSLPGALGHVARMTPHLDEWSGRAVAIGIGCVIVVLAVRSISRLLPGALLAVILAAGVVASQGWDAQGVPVIGALPSGLPALIPPPLNWTDAQALFGGALALALLGMLEAVAIAKTLNDGRRVDANQEFIAQGLANLVSSFFQCIPGSGSFTRSALDKAAGGRTRFSAVFNALFTAAIFGVLAAQAKYIPKASLAAVLFVIAFGLIDVGYFRRILRSRRADAAVFAATLLATLLAPLEFAIFIGIFLNLGLYVRQSSRLHMAEMVQSPSGRFMETPIADRRGEKPVVLVQVEGELFFGVADDMRDRLDALYHSEARVVILRLRRTHSIDSTVLAVLEQFVRQMQAAQRHVLLCGVRNDLMRVIRDYGLLEVVGRDNVFRSSEGVFGSVRQAVERARQLVGRSIDADALRLDDDDEAFVYEI
jgi:SulP family sulfate permease